MALETSNNEMEIEPWMNELSVKYGIQAKNFAKISKYYCVKNIGLQSLLGDSKNYIKTNSTIDQDSRVVLDFELTVMPYWGDKVIMAFSVQERNVNKAFDAWLKWNNNDVFHYGSQTASFQSKTELNKRYIIDANKNNWSLEDTNGNVILNKTFNYESFTTPSELPLFGLLRNGLNYESDNSILKINKCEIYQNDILKELLLPAKNGDICGMADAVNCVFLPELGIGKMSLV